MLHRSFKSGKCKTSLKLAAARIKLLKNKREALLRQMKRDLAQLLESGQEKTAMIRVEHVVREEKTMAAYDIIEIYCELIVARLPIIESQKNCPIDLKEAISGVIFASPRCADVPELLDVRKLLTTKYGKEFTAAALELRPECGVNRTMVEKLSARAPNGETKLKILSAIAQEHNVKWDPEAFGEKELNPPEDLLNGPRTFETANKMPVDSSSIQLPATPGQQHESSTNFSERNVSGSSPRSQSFASTNTSTRTMTKPTTSHPELRASESGTEEREIRRSSSKDENAFSMNSQNWNMEFKDATSAAQAAAESAERASIAARAAAELSSRENITRQYSAERHESSVYGFRDEGRGKSSPKVKGEHVAKNSMKMVDDSQKSSSYGMDPRMQNQQKDRNEIDNLRGVTERIHDGYGSIKRRSSPSVSSGSSIGSIDDEILVTNPQKVDRYHQKSSSVVEDVNPNWQTKKPESGVFRGEVRINEQSSQSEVEFVNQQRRSKKTENTYQFGEGMIKKQYSESASSRSHKSTHDDVISDPDLQKYANDSGQHSSMNTGQGDTQRGFKQPSFNDHPSVVFDESDSDKDCNFGVEDEYSGHEFDPSDVPSPVRKSPSHLSANASIWSPRQHRSGSLEDKSSAQSLFDTEPRSPSESSERMMKTTVPSKSDDLLPVTFDASDGLDSESEEETDNFKLSGGIESGSRPHKQNVFTISSESAETDKGHGSMKSSMEKEATGANKKPWLHSSSDDSEYEGAHRERNQEMKLNVGGESAQTDKGHGSMKSSFKEKKAAGKNRKSWLHSSSDDSESEGPLPERNQESKLDVGGASWKKYGQADLPSEKPFHIHTRSPGNLDDLDQEPFYRPRVEGKQQPLRSSRLPSAKEVKAKDDFSASGSPDAMKDSEFPNYSRSESDQEIGLGRLTGGFRNKGGYIRPPYTRGTSGDALPLSRRQAAEDTPTVIEKPIVSPMVKSSMGSEACYQELHNQKPRIEVHKESSSRSSETVFDSDSDEQAAEDTPTVIEQPTVSPMVKSSMGSEARYQEQHNPKPRIEVHKESISRSSKTIFDSDSDDAEVLPRQTVGGRGYTGGRISRRTRGSPAASDVSSLSRFTSGSEVPVASDFGMGRKPSPQSSYTTKPITKSQTQTVSTGSGENSKRRETNTSVELKQQLSKPTAQPEVSMRKERLKSPKTNTPVERQPSKFKPESEVSVHEESLKSSQPSSAVEQLSNTPPKSVASRSTETAKPSSLSEASASRENSLKRASHVHPKLPDYDTFAAHFESLRSNRRSS